MYDFHFFKNAKLTTVISIDFYCKAHKKEWSQDTVQI